MITVCTQDLKRAQAAEHGRLAEVVRLISATKVPMTKQPVREDWGRRAKRAVITRDLDVVPDVRRLLSRAKLDAL